MNSHDFRKVGVTGDCCGICVFNQRTGMEDVCDKSVCKDPESNQGFVCDLFEMQPDSMRLSDLQVGDEVEYNIDEPYRGNCYAGPFEVVSIDFNGFSYPVRHRGEKFNVHIGAPLRGYKKVK